MTVEHDNVIINSKKKNINFQVKKENENTQINVNKFQNIIETAEVIKLIYKGEIEKIERPINNIGDYRKYIKVILECIKEGTSILNDIKKLNKDSFDFEIWANLSSKIMSIIKKTFYKYQDIKEWDSKKRLELSIIVIYEIIFNHYYILYSNKDLTEKDNKVLYYVFSEEGRLALKCVCNATVVLFNEIDENNDGEITISEIKTCCCTPSKWCSIFKSCIPKKKS